MDARCSRLDPHGIKHLVKQFDIFFRAAVNGRRNSALAGEARPSGKLLTEAALHIGCDQQRDPGKGLEFLQLPWGMLDRSPKENETADSFLNERINMLEVPGITESRAFEPGHDHLSDFSPE